MLSTSEKITQKIRSMPEDITFGYEQLPIGREEFWSAAKTMERLQKKGLIRKLSKGKFYKPKMTVFGEKQPGEQDILKSYLYQKGQRMAYITGISLYNQLGLTTQIPSVIQIASRSRRNIGAIGTIKVSPVKSYVDVTDENYQILGFLDAMKDLKKIPDVDVSAALAIFKNRIKGLGPEQQSQMVDYALSYPPRVRALLGAVMEDIKSGTDLNGLKESLNPLTRFELSIPDAALKTALNWNIQ
ncbi:DUF6088 family protein [Dyadobacter bucti]|uniref:DUF6088 family protein n=1 Tax=Dyadobacter bucti TaxID=2572203 RepID=UPI0011090883|nr:DUF6088 family protein [Dyadobacter bucti]